MKNKLPAIFVFLVLILGSIIYSNSLHSSFQFDDQEYILNNPYIKEFTNPIAIFNSMKGHRRFVSTYTFAFNHYLHGFNVVGYHVFNIIIHLINTFLVWWLVNLIMLTPRLQKENQQESKMTAYAAALLFLVHPIQTQAVTYISQRMAALATMFYIATVCFYILARLNQQKQRSFVLFSGCALLGLLGVFSKEIVLTLPLAIILVELCFFMDKFSFRKLLWGFFTVVLMALSVLIMFGTRAFDFVFRSMPSESHPGDTINNFNYLLTQFEVIVTYLRLLVFPVGQNLDYDFAVSSGIFDPVTIVCFLGLLSLIVFAVKVYKHNALVTFGILWFFIALLVEASILPITHVIFEHRAYLPSVGFCIAVIAGGALLIKNRKAFVVTLSMVLLCFSVLTYQRNKVWQTPITLWQDVIEKSPQKARGYNNLAVNLAGEKRYGEAIEHFNKAIAINPEYTDAYLNKAVAYYNSKNYAQALRLFEKVLEIDPKNLPVYLHRGYVYLMTGQNKRALSDMNKAVKGLPYSDKPLVHRGVIYGIKGQYNQALADFNKALKLNPNNPATYSNRGLIYSTKRQFDLAISDFNKAVELDPENNDAYYNRSMAYNEMGEKQKALEDVLMLQSLGEVVDQTYVRSLEN